MQAESLLDPKYMGGLNAAKGFRFETSYILNCIQTWVSSGVESFQQETWSDVELFLLSGSRRVIQIKDHALSRPELAEVLNEFSLRDRTFRYEQYVIASAGLAPSVEKLARQLERYRSLDHHNQEERRVIAQKIENTLQQLNLHKHHTLILKKVFFDGNLASLRNHEFCRNAFLGGLVSAYKISTESAEQIFFRTAELLTQSHGKLIKLSLFRHALLQAELENQETSLSSFRLIRKQFLESLQNGHQRSFFYSGSAPTWSDVLKGLDIPRDIADEIGPQLTEWKHGSIFIPVVAEAGEGKSTLLKRLAADLANNHKAVLFHDGSRLTVDFQEVQRIARITQECVYVFFDEVAKVQNLQAFLQSISELPISVVIIGAARPYEMATVRSAYAVNMQVALDAHGCEYSLKGLSDREIELLVDRLLEEKLLSLPVGIDPSLAAEVIKKRTDRKFLVLSIELTKGGKVQEIIRDEILRIQRKGERLLSLYRYVCLMGTVGSFITVPMMEELLHNKNIRIDVLSELPGLVIVEGDRLYPRHNRIGEIATEIFFKGADDDLGHTLCTIISIAGAHGELDVLRSATTIPRSVPACQKIRVVNHLIDELCRLGETELIEKVIEHFQWADKSTELFLEFLTANTLFLWSHVIFPKGPELQWCRIEDAFDLSFRVSQVVCEPSKSRESEESFDSGFKWAQIYGRAAWFIGNEPPFLAAITSRIYDVLVERYPNKECEICFAHGEFLSEAWQQEAAIPLYQRVLSHRPEDGEAHAGLSSAFYLMDDYYLALHHFRNVMRIDPQCLFRVANEHIFEEMTKRVLELEEYIQFKKAVVAEKFRTGRGHQNLMAMVPTLMVNLGKEEVRNPNSGFVSANRFDYGEQEELRHIAELDDVLTYLSTATPAERQQLETAIDESFGDLRESIAKSAKSSSVV